MDNVVTLIIAMGIPSAITAFCFNLIEKHAKNRDELEKHEREKRQRELDEREHIREKSQLHMMKTIQASLALGEATAKAVQRIPDAKCNGDMHKALAYAEQVKHEQKDFYNEQAIKHMY